MPKTQSNRALIEAKLANGRKLSKTELALFVLRAKKDRDARADEQKLR